MGGFGSGRWLGRKRREVVENCHRVSARDLPGGVSASERVALPLRDHRRTIVRNIPAECWVLENGILALTFRMRITGEPLIQAIPLDWTVAGRGGCRLCFRCPFPVGETICGKLSRVLYAPPGKTFLGCRECHDLVYSSSQHRRERLARSEMAADRIADEADVISNRIERGESVKFHETLRSMGQMSSAISDIWELLHQPADGGSES